jgi:hypothetical protein
MLNMDCISIDSIGRGLSWLGKWLCLLVVCGPVAAYGADSGQSRNHPEPPRIVSSFTAVPGAHYPFRENMYRPMQLPNGKIIALSIARNHGQQTMQARYSSDDGNTWSAPEDLFQWPKAAGGFGLIETLVDKDGEIHIFSLCDGNGGGLYPKQEEGTPIRAGTIMDVWDVRSLEGRTRWTTPKLIWTGEAGDLLSAIQLRNGRLILPINISHGRSLEDRGGGFLDFTYVGDWGVITLYSDDDGDTWKTANQELVVETPNLFTYGANEPVVLQLKDGRVWMLMRTQRGRFYESFSDDGVRWTTTKPSTLIASDAPAGLLRLKNGSILLFSNACLRYAYGYGARYVLHVAISKDEGKTWRGFREVARDPDRNQPITFDGDYGLAYTFPTQTTDGNVLFSNWVEEGAVRHFRLMDPSWIYETRQSADFSKGLDDWSVFGSKGAELQADSANSAAKVLSIRKAESDWPAGAVWNFPVGSKGQLKLKIKLRTGFGGANLGLTDHFSVPWDVEDQFFNAFNLPLSPSGQILPNVRLVPERWYELTFDWDTSARRCRILVDGKFAGIVEDDRRAKGINYLRIRSLAVKPDAGLEIGSVAADVSAAWPAVTKANAPPTSSTKGALRVN